MPLSLNDVKARVLTCQSCGLSKSCLSPIPIDTQTNHPHFIILGEAPGQVEDRQGKPFVGPAGTFLKRSLRKAGLRAVDGAFMNTVSCYPKARKTPTPEEIAACKVNLYTQLDVLNCSYVLVCGAIALRTLLPHAEPMYANGQPVHAHGKVLFPVYHPAYILRSRQALEGWERHLRMFSGLVNNPLETVQTIQQVTGHCFYCNSQKATDSLTCTTHAKWLRQDQNRVIPKPKMVETQLW